MYRDLDMLERGGLGRPVDIEKRRILVENGGLTGKDGHIDRGNSLENATSLESYGSQRDMRLQEIESELAGLLVEKDPSDENIEAVLMLEVEKTMLSEEIAVQIVDENPIDTELLVHELEKLHDTRAEALKDYLITNLMEHGENDDPIDAEMYAEAEVLAQFIAEANPSKGSKGLVKIARAMKDAISARNELNRFLSAV